MQTDHLYNPDRIPSPLRRVGKQAKPVEANLMDEAFHEITLRLKALQAEKKHHDFVLRNTWICEQ